MKSQARPSRQDRITRPRLLAVATVALATLTLTFGLGSASAVELHPAFAPGPIGPDGTSATAFDSDNILQGIAFQPAGKRLYALATPSSEAPAKLYGFDTSTPGTYTPLPGFSPLLSTEPLAVPSSLALDNSTLSSAGNIYFAGPSYFQNVDPDKAFGYLPNANPLAGWPVEVPPSDVSGFSDLAVDPSTGNLWVVDTFPINHGIRRFSPSGTALPPLLVNEPLGRPTRIALDSNGDLYALIGETVYRFDAPTYESHTKIAETKTTQTQLAVDPDTHELYVAESNHRIEHYSSDGTLLEEFAVELPGGVRDIALNPANGDAYVATTEKIYLFPGVNVPLPTTGAISDPTETTVTLNGAVRPDGPALTGCHFDYVSEESFRAHTLNELQTVTPTGAGGGTFTLTFESATTAPIPFDATAEQVRGELSALATVGFPNSPNVAVTGAPGGPYTVEFKGFLAHTDVPQLSSDSSALTPPGATVTAATTTTGDDGWSVAAAAACTPAAASIPTSGQTAVSAAASGLSAGVPYRFRLVATNSNGRDAGHGVAFTLGKPILETTGSPLRTATTAKLQGRLYPHGIAATYHFEYGDQGPCDANPCQTTEAMPAGSGGEVEFVSQAIAGLQPATTYHYRIVADNGSSGGPAVGDDFTLTTRASDIALGHGHFPGPPGSDRAWEQVSLPDSGGNPVRTGFGVSDNGDRASYTVVGGTPISTTGSIFNLLFAEREETAPHQGAWRSRNIGPPRAQLVGPLWEEPADSPDLSAQIALNADSAGAFHALWRLRPDQPAAEVFATNQAVQPFPVIVSADASRVLVTLEGSPDPAHPASANTENVYDVTSGAPHLVGLLPDGSVPACGARAGTGGNSREFAPRAPHWLSSDGSLLFFESCTGLYLRDLVSEQTKLVAPGGHFIKSTPAAAFFITDQSLDPSDAGASNDVYRYDLGDESLHCVTCLVPGLEADVGEVAVSEDGSRLYFKSSTALLPGAATPGIYRVNLVGNDLAYVAPGSGAQIGDDPLYGEAITPDGSTLLFASNDSRLDALGGQHNGGHLQFYRYDDSDRSLTCLSCPADGSAPPNPVDPSLVPAPRGVGANRTALSADGATFAFATPNRLLPADQNTPASGQQATSGKDIYEWRDGRLLLVSDGLTNWPDEGPQVTGIDPSGRDLFFTAAAQLTPDALDGYRRLYDARIGGGFEYPEPPKPCPLEVCQGTPNGAPEESLPGSATLQGPGNPRPRAHHKKRHHKQRRTHRAKHNRRTAR